jgi:ATP-binding cassette subfamily F protein uup
MDKMVDHLFVFEGEGEVKDILGNYTVFRKQKQIDDRAAKKEASNATPAIEKVEAPVEVKKEVVNSNRKLSFKEKMEFEQIEKDMESLEEEKGKLTLVLSSPDSSNDDLMKAGQRLSVVVSELEEKTDRWLELSEFV